MSTHCLFCQIVNKEVPSSILRENNEFIAFLDLFPNCKGQCLIIPKQHYDSDLFTIEEPNFYERYLVATKEVSTLLKKKLHVQRVGMIMEGMGVNHLHIKLYPMWGLSKEWKPDVHPETVFFESYPGFLTTQTGPMASPESLKSLVLEIKEGK